MKILHAITSMQKAAGTSVFCGEVSNGLFSEGHEVTIAVINPASADVYPIKPQIRVVSIDSLLCASMSESPAPFDIIHIHALWAPVLHKTVKWAHDRGISVVWSPHGMLTPWAMQNKRWKKYLAWWLYQRGDLAMADMLHATAESEVEDIQRMGLKNKVMIAPLGVTLSFLTQRRRGTERVLLFVSRVQRKKGLLNLAKAWSILKSQISNSRLQTSNWRVRIVGPDQEGHTQEVKAECEKLGIIDDWEFVGPKYGDELQAEYDNADLFVLPTYSENFGSVVVEALAHCVPVICTKGAPWKELETHECGWWVDIGVEPLTKTLQEAMLLDEASRREMGVRGRMLIESKYTWDAVIKAMVSGYEEVLNGRT